MLLEEDIYSLIGAEIYRERYGLESNGSNLDIEFLDIALQTSVVFVVN